MSRAFKLPDLGEGVHEGEVLAVHVSAGQVVKEGDIILEVETDKAAVEIPSPFSGTVADIRVKPGDTVRVGDVMMTFSSGEEAETTGAPAPETAQRDSAAIEEAPSLVETGKRTGPVPASPATRRLARELSVDLHRVTPTGPGGVVSADDVRAFAGKGPDAAGPPAAAEMPSEAQTADMLIPSPTLPDFSRWGPIERMPFRSIRRATAKQMVIAWSQIPHVTSQDEVDITKLEAFRRKHKADIEAEGGRLTMTVFAIKAVATALKMYPQFNATLDVAAGEIIYKNYFHIGVAANTENGLIVPVIRDVDRKSIKELAIELHDLVQRTRSRKVALEELQGGTFTITNAGAMGGGYFAPIINFPEVAIMGMGQGRLQPAVVDKGDGEHEIAPRLIMPIVLCIDHRVLDGADAIKFLKTVIEALEDPDELLISMI
ncbi:MAG: 2-oxo acid dehydrogenase subunit E2 [Deltaproteobacteria bacterium]|jgi:pyruvate dehydrogenase E2 component (dihydrolipoamide acetyltransferase)|nr:2-oxo acid dehydrogenase subunit E2 [Deltaproteobacteria bacterium]